ncbi:enolase C-terminal domain-like protein [Halorubrum laminariae]|uniref:glucarate dehydratase n=1 Tax=Halorubrum laminariae TaxID=1433523 RepID=A0ABD6C3J6_9EURY|nr:enolase C-terminal domain-like protein [Halorubrum laminariae]
MSPEITQIELTAFTYPITDVRLDHTKQKLVYAPGETYERQVHGLRIHTDTEYTGEYIGGGKPAATQVGICAEYLIGADPLKREKHWNAMREMLRKYDQMGLGIIDIALWDFAGKYAGLPIHELLGTHRTRLPAYASTYFTQTDSGLSSPEDFADFAETCCEYGYQGFKTHTWCETDTYDIEAEIDLIEAVGERVGDRMALMHDPVAKYETRADALKVGRACDEYEYFWYEDPYKDTGRSQHGHRTLRQSMDTPLLQTELVRGVEPTIDFVVNEATDFARADPEWDGGITGAMKIARAAEGLGVDIEYHLAGPAQRHCMAATRNSNFYELGLVHPTSKNPHSEYPVYQNGYTDRIDSIDEDGTVGVPDGPGLGVEYDWEYVNENLVERAVYE